MYENLMQWSDWLNQTAILSRILIDNIIKGKQLYDKWSTMTYGLTPTQIKALSQFSGVTITDADITNISYCLGVFNDLYSSLNNISIPQFNRQDYLIPFI